MHSELFNQVLKIKKVRPKFLKVVKNNKKFRNLFMFYIIASIFYLSIATLYLFSIFDNDIYIGLVTLFFVIFIYIMLKSPIIETMPNEISLQRKNELNKILRLLGINRSNEIRTLQELVENWASQHKPKKINWAIILIFYSVIYTSFISVLVNDIVTSNQFEYLYLLFLSAIFTHLVFIILKLLFEFILYNKAESTYRFLKWTSSQLKEIELETTIREKSNQP